MIMYDELKSKNESIARENSHTTEEFRRQTFTKISLDMLKGRIDGYKKGIIW